MRKLLSFFVLLILVSGLFSFLYVPVVPNVKAQVELNYADKNGVSTKIKLDTAKIEMTKWKAESKVIVGITDPVTGYTSTPDKSVIVFTTGKDYEVQILNTSDGFKYNVILGKLPPFNTFNFTIALEHAVFYYQPPLNESEVIPKGWFANATHIIDETGTVQNYRPENVVGSYAVYHDSKSNNEYNTGKIMHIYRPLIVDTKGKTTWGKLLYDVEIGILTITVDNDWLKNAKYPVTVDPSFGYTAVGGTSAYSTNSHLALKTSPAESGTVVKISVYCRAYSGSYLGDTQAAIYSVGKSDLVPPNDDKKLVPLAKTDTVQTVAAAGWLNLSFSGGNIINVVAGTKYGLCFTWNKYSYMYWGSGDEGIGVMVRTGNFIDNWATYQPGGTADVDANFVSSYKYSIFCNYTVGGGDTTKPTYTNPATNTTIANKPCNFSVALADETALANYTFGTNNTGPWVNDSAVTISGKSYKANTTYTLNGTVGYVIQWEYWFADSSNNLNNTGIQSLTTTGQTLKAYPTIPLSAYDNGTRTSTFQKLSSMLEAFVYGSLNTLAFHRNPSLIESFVFNSLKTSAFQKANSMILSSAFDRLNSLSWLLHSSIAETFQLSSTTSTLITLAIYGLIAIGLLAASIHIATIEHLSQIALAFTSSSLHQLAGTIKNSLTLHFAENTSSSIAVAKESTTPLSFAFTHQKQSMMQKLNSLILTISSAFSQASAWFLASSITMQLSTFSTYLSSAIIQVFSSIAFTFSQLSERIVSYRWESLISLTQTLSNYRQSLMQKWHNFLLSFSSSHEHTFQFQWQSLIPVTHSIPNQRQIVTQRFHEIQLAIISAYKRAISWLLHPTIPLTFTFNTVATIMGLAIILTIFGAIALGFTTTVLFPLADYLEAFGSNMFVQGGIICVVVAVTILFSIIIINKKKSLF